MGLSWTLMRQGVIDNISKMIMLIPLCDRTIFEESKETAIKINVSLIFMPNCQFMDSNMMNYLIMPTTFPTYYSITINNVNRANNLQRHFVTYNCGDVPCKCFDISIKFIIVNLQRSFDQLGKWLESIIITTIQESVHQQDGCSQTLIHTALDSLPKDNYKFINMGTSFSKKRWY